MRKSIPTNQRLTLKLLSQVVNLVNDDIARAHGTKLSPKDLDVFKQAVALIGQVCVCADVRARGCGCGCGCGRGRCIAKELDEVYKQGWRA